jgi:four helix bundle protein
VKRGWIGGEQCLNFAIRNLLRMERSEEFKWQMAKLKLQIGPVARRIGDQLLRSAIAVGAHYEEAQAGESRADFVHKLQLALKELRESNYWLRLLERAGTLPPRRLEDILDESNQLKAMLSKAVATTKRRQA